MIQRKKLPKLILITIFVLPLTILFAFLAYQAYRYANPSQAVNFTIYEPTYLPEQLRITEKELSVWSNKGPLQFIITSTNIHLRLSDNKSRISLFQSKRSFEQLKQDVCNLENTTCEIKRTPANQTFILSHTYYSENNLIHTVANLIKNDTHILIQLDPLSGDTDWSTTIDSFQPAGPKDYKTRYYHPGP